MAADRPRDVAAYTVRLLAYLEASPAFYGTAAALLDETANVSANPYIHRSTDGFRSLDLAQPE